MFPCMFLELFSLPYLRLPVTFKWFCSIFFLKDSPGTSVGLTNQCDVRSEKKSNKSSDQKFLHDQGSVRLSEP